MRKHCLILLGCGLAVLGCGPGKNSPERVAEQYLTALKNKNWDKAKQYADQSAQDEIDCMLRLGADWGLTEVKEVRCIVDENTSTCNFCCHQNELENINLIKSHGKWLVAGKKESCADED